MSKAYLFNQIKGFSLMETMAALILMAFGMLAAAPMFTIAISSDSLGRSKVAAATAAQDKLESLADLYRRNPSAEELEQGIHGPVQIYMVNPCSGTLLNRFNLVWTVGSVPDPRPGKAIDARLVRVAVTPIHANGTPNPRSAFNKILNVTTILSSRMK